MSAEDGFFDKEEYKKQVFEKLRNTNSDEWAGEMLLMLAEEAELRFQAEKERDQLRRDIASWVSGPTH